MTTWGRANWITLGLALAWSIGCSRKLAVPAADGAPGSERLPFARASDGAGVYPTSGFSGDEVPAGTEVIIRLAAALSSANARVGDSFQGRLDEAVIVDGKVVLPRGVLATGNIVDTRGSASHDPGFLRVTLVSIALNGRSVPVQTSSIFTKGMSYRQPQRKENNDADSESHRPAENGIMLASVAPGDVRFSTGHRFTFRLIQPFHP